MNIGSLFVLLGVKGADKTQKQIKGVRDDMISVSKSGLGAIAAIAGVSYGLKGLYDASLRSGVGLQKFANFTGESIDKLQRWQYMGRQFNVANEEMAASIQGIQAAMDTARIEGEFPKTLARMGEFVQDLDPSRVQDTFYMLEKFQKLAQSGADRSIVRDILGQYMSPDMIGFLSQNKLTADMVPGSAVMSAGQAKGLSNLKASMSNVQHQLEMAMVKLANEVGPSLIKQFQEAIPAIVNLTKELAAFLGWMMKGLNKFDNQVKDPESETNKFLDTARWLILGRPGEFRRKVLGDESVPTEGTEGLLAPGMLKSMADNLSNEIAVATSANGGNTFIVNQTNNGITARDSNMIAGRTTDAMTRAASKTNAQTKSGGTVR